MYRALELALDSQVERSRALDTKEIVCIPGPLSGANVRSGGSHGPVSRGERNSSAPGASRRCATLARTRKSRNGSIGDGSSAG